MSPNGFRQLQLNFSGMGCWLTLGIGLMLMTTVGIGWLLKSLFALLVLIVLIPVLLVVGVQIWLRRNLVQGDCPSCGQALTGFKTMPSSCPSCGVGLQTSNGTFVRSTPEGTIDVDVINVDVDAARTDAGDAAMVVDVDVLPPAD